MKRIRRFKFLCIVLLFVLFFGVSVPTFSARAEPITESIETSSGLSEILKEQIDALDLSALQAYIDSLNTFSGNVKERLIGYIQGESVDYQNFADELLHVLFSKIFELVPFFACVLAIALLSGVLSALNTSSSGIASSNMLTLASYASALIPLISVLIDCFTQTFNTMCEIKEQSEILYPIMITLLSAGGSTMSAAICKPSVAFFSNGIISIITSVVLPFTVLIIVFSVANNFSTELKIGKLCDFFKSINKWLIGLCVSVFGLFLTVQGLGAGAYDGIVKRAAKYAVGNGVPIIGGFLSGGFDLAVAGSVLIKNALGVMGVFLMVSVLFEPVVSLIAVTLFLRFTSAVTQSLCDGKISSFLSETADNLRFCTAGLLLTAFLYFLSIVIMILSSEALF